MKPHITNDSPSPRAAFRAGARAALRVALVIALGACTSEVVMVPPPPCGGPIEIIDTGGTPPTFSWLPECGVTRFTVRHETAVVDPDPTVWLFTAPENAPIGPKIIYGKLPQRATELVAPKSLTPGEVYRVTVEFLIGGDVVSASGTKTFTWYPPD